MLNVYLLRHGETLWNADGNRYCGRTDIPLTNKGINQAQLVREQCRDIVFDAVYSSPLERAFRTAQIAGAEQQVITDQRLIEADFGIWEGKTKEEFIVENAVLWNNWINDPAVTRAGETGETALEIVRRVDDFFQEAQRRHPAGNILVIGHNGINRFYLAYKLGMPLRHYRKITQENASVTLFSLDENGELALLKLNCR